MLKVIHGYKGESTPATAMRQYPDLLLESEAPSVKIPKRDRTNIQSAKEELDNGDVTFFPAGTVVNSP